MILIEQAREVADNPVGDFFRGVGGDGWTAQGQGRLEVIGHSAGAGEQFGVVVGKVILRHIAGFASRGQFGQRGSELGDPITANVERRQVRLREVAVVVGILLAALGYGDLARFDPAAGFLDDLAAVFEDAALALNLVLQGLEDGAEAIHVLDFGARSEGLAAHGPDADVGVAAEVAILHIGGGHAEELDERVQGGEILAGFLGRAQVGFADDFHEGDAGAVDVHQGVAIAAVAIGEMLHLGYVFFEMDALDADASPVIADGGVAVDFEITFEGPGAGHTGKSGSPSSGRGRGSSCGRTW